MSENQNNSNSNKSNKQILVETQAENDLIKAQLAEIQIARAAEAEALKAEILASREQIAALIAERDAAKAARSAIKVPEGFVSLAQGRGRDERSRAVSTSNDPRFPKMDNVRMKLRTRGQDYWIETAFNEAWGCRAFKCNGKFFASPSALATEVKGSNEDGWRAIKSLRANGEFVSLNFGEAPQQ